MTPFVCAIVVLLWFGWRRPGRRAGRLMSSGSITDVRDVQPARAADAIDTRLPSMITRDHRALRVVVLTVVFLVLCFGVPYLLTSYWLQITLQAVIYSAVTSASGCSSAASGCSRCARWCSS